MRRLTSAQNKHPHADRRAAEDGAHAEEADEGEQDALAPEALYEPTHEWKHGGGRDGVCASRPDKVVSMELFDDSG